MSLPEPQQSRYLDASWPYKPANVHALTTLRYRGGQGGCDQDEGDLGDFAEFNLATHVGDDPQQVQANRETLRQELKLPCEPKWLNQVHSNIVYTIETGANDVIPTADASVTQSKHAVCVVLTADCLPVFICNQNGDEVAVAHAGWRGLHAGIISTTIAAMQSAKETLLVSLGPAISPAAFEVGKEVYDAFVSKYTPNREAFRATDESHYLCDIYHLARIELATLGITAVSGGTECSFSDSRFYSFRSQAQTGRMASLIWFT